MKTFEMLKKNKKINSVHLFGSNVTKKSNSLSDINICIIGSLDSDEKLKIISLFPENYDVYFFENLPIWMKIRVFREGRVLFVKDRNRLYETLFATIREYEDFLPIIKRRVVETFGAW